MMQSSLLSSSLLSGVVLALGLGQMMNILALASWL